MIVQGDDGDFLYVVYSGCLLAYKDGVLVKKYDGEGYFGELALLYNQPRAATIVAQTTCSLAALVCLPCLVCS